MANALVCANDNLARANDHLTEFVRANAELVRANGAMVNAFVRANNTLNCRFFPKKLNYKIHLFKILSKHQNSFLSFDFKQMTVYHLLLKVWNWTVRKMAPLRSRTTHSRAQP